MALTPEQRYALRQKLFPAADTLSFGVVEQALRQHLQPGAAVLDAGSGTGTWVLKPLARRAGRLVAVDATLPAATDPAWQQSKATPALADLAALPFADASFDLILCYDVVEHLADPVAVFAQFARALVPGGILIVQTPAAYSPVMLLSRVLPFALHRRLKSGLDQAPQRVFPTLYRCNTPGQLDAALRDAGFTREQLVTADQTYDYLYFSRITYAIGLLYSRLIAQPRLSWLRSVIIGVYRRAYAAEGSR